MTRKKLFCGKPMSHWEAMAKEMVVDVLLRASLRYDHRSIPGKIASDRLWELANAESPEIVQKLLDERSRCQEGMAQILAECLP